MVLIVNLCRRVGGTIPYVGDPELYKRAMWQAATLRFLLHFFVSSLIDYQVRSLIRGDAMWNGEQAHLQVPDFSHCWTVSWNCKSNEPFPPNVAFG